MNPDTEKAWRDEADELANQHLIEPDMLSTPRKSYRLGYLEACKARTEEHEKEMKHWNEVHGRIVIGLKEENKKITENYRARTEEQRKKNEKALESLSRLELDFELDGLRNSPMMEDLKKVKAAMEAK